MAISSFELSFIILLNSSSSTNLFGSQSMKKLFFIFTKKSGVLLILSTAIIKNSAKKNEDKIFTVKENIRVLNSELEKIKLEFDYLSSSDKLLEFQSLYFENDLVQKKIENIKVFKIINKDKEIKNLKIIRE